MNKLLKFTKYLLIVGSFVILASLIFEKTYPYSSQITYGVSFSPNYAKYLGLDYQQTYLKILDELNVKFLRLTTFWDTIEKDPQKDNFTEVDFMLDEAGKRGAKVILVLGARQPRWPECHIPFWTKQLNLKDRQTKILEFVQKTVERYKDHLEIWAWQVENEPFAFWFGEKCDSPDKDFLQREVKLVRSLDTKRPVIITDSGEWGSWVTSMKFADVLGISVYKKSYNATLRLYTSYPFQPWMYSLKSAFLRKLFAPQNQKTIIAELQAEPWLSDEDSREALPERENQLFSLENFKANINFAKKTGFDSQYLWGVEWWFWMARNGHPEYLDYAKTLFSSLH